MTPNINLCWWISLSIIFSDLKIPYVRQVQKICHFLFLVLVEEILYHPVPIEIDKTLVNNGWNIHININWWQTKASFHHETVLYSELKRTVLLPDRQGATLWTLRMNGSGNRWGSRVGPTFVASRCICWFVSAAFGPQKTHGKSEGF